MSLPLISVVIPCYNQGAFVGEAVDSVLAQTVQDFEILVLDDGSDDQATIAALDRGRWPRTTVFRTRNLGLAGARNYLVARARGEYLCALDADDKLHDQYFERTLGAFSRDADLTFVSSRMEMFGEVQGTSPDDLTCDLPTLLCHCPIFPAALVRRASVLAVGGYDEQLNPGNEDWGLWISLLEAHGRGMILPEVLFHYRRRSGSMCDVCTRGQIYLDHVGYLMRKHAASYRRHLRHRLAWQERQLGEQRLANHRLAAEIGNDLEAVVERRQSELTTLQARLAGSCPSPGAKVSPMPARSPSATASGYRALQAEYDRCLQEVAALKASRSWKATAPLRAAYELLLAWRSRPKV